MVAGEDVTALRLTGHNGAVTGGDSVTVACRVTPALRRLRVGPLAQGVTWSLPGCGRGTQFGDTRISHPVAKLNGVSEAGLLAHAGTARVRREAPSDRGPAKESASGN